MAGGQCLDGSPAGFYYAKPPSGSSNLWVIGLEGGGACFSESTCMSRANGSLGSSKYWTKTLTSSNQVYNDPDFSEGHAVFGPYCNGDVWTGN